MDNVFQAIVAHYDEIGLKGKNQIFFIKKLIENIKKISGIRQVYKGEGKIEIHGNFDREQFERMKFIPGISNIAPAFVCPTNLKKIGEAALKMVEIYEPRTFKIETSRSYKQFDLNSLEVSARVGAYIFENISAKNGLSVDVHKPELQIKIELAKAKTYVLGKKESGIGGLPVGTAGKVVCLLSGGIDSPVAAFQMMRRGAEVVFVHFQNKTINTPGVQNKIKRLVKRLARIQGRSKLYIVPFANLQKQVIAVIPADIRMIVYRRLMFVIAELIAQKEMAGALITGDSLSQVASQTLSNLKVIYSVAPILKLAPLIGSNKSEIMDLAQKIGTYEISIEPYGDCCSLFIAKHPETRAAIGVIEAAEGALDRESAIEDAVREAEEVIIDV